MDITQLVFIQKENSHIKEAARFFSNGLGAFILDYGNNLYEIIPVIGNAQNNKPAEEFEEIGNLYTCTVNSIDDVFKRLKEIESFTLKFKNC